MLQVLMAVIGPIYGHVGRFIMSFTLYRLMVAAWLLPVYVIRITLTIFPTILLKLPSLFTSSGRDALVRETEEYRKLEQSLADLQLKGDYRFPRDLVYPIPRGGMGWMSDRPFGAFMKGLSVCGATARYVQLEPKSRSTTVANGVKRPILLLHGNPSRNYIWRNVSLFRAWCVFAVEGPDQLKPLQILPGLADRGHEVYALDWLGHGRSDKIMQRGAITFELHMRTLIQFFEDTGLEDAILVAHDWGG